MRNWKDAKATIESLSLEEKRAVYRCGDKFVMLSDILTWPAYALGKKELPPPPPPAEKEEERISEVPALNEKVSLWRGDITQLEVDAIVNAANSSLLGGGGVDGAIHRAAGVYLYDECETLNGCATGGAKITGGYKLPAKYVIHTVGPQGEYKEDLEKCYQKSFTLMHENRLRSIAFPCIATGIYGYPNEAAAHVALSVARDFLETHPEDVDRIIFTTFMEVDVKVYEKLLQQYFPLTLPPKQEQVADSPGLGSPQKDSPKGSPDPKTSPESKDSPGSPQNTTKTSPESKDSPGSPQNTTNASPGSKDSPGSPQNTTNTSPGSK